MTEKEKARAYDEALKKARQLCDYPTTKPFISDLQDLFPELKESEDERIRKRIIHALHGDVLDMEETTKAISWLEKQGEPEDMGEVSDGYHTFNELYYYRMLYNAAFFNRLPKDWVHKSKRHHDGEECFGGGWFIVMANLPTGQISNHYELKDWDLFQIPEKDIADEWDGHTPQEAAERLHKFLLEKQGKQKPAAKYKVGDTIYYDSFGRLVSFVIANIVEDGTDNPMYEDKDGNSVFQNDIVEQKQGEQNPADKVEPKFHEGEWVVTSYGKVNQVIAVDEDGDGFTLDDDTYFSGSWKDGYHLWTIEDAKDGDVLATPNYVYIFNSIDKETETVIFYCLMKKSDEYFSFGDYRIHDEILNSTPATKEQRDTLMKAMADAGWEFDFEKKELKKIEQKPTWSVEDMSKIQRICKYLDEAKKYYADITEVRECMDWLKSLNNRVQPKPKQKWKQENIEELTKFENAMMHIGDSFFGENAGLDPNDTAMIKEQAKLLLELVPKQEWSEEDERRINRISDFIWKNRKGDTDEIYQQEQDVNWLKSFIPQKQWKPSNVQMQALKEACDIYWEPDGSDALYTLYEQLKKLTE